jgi:hypothetical protein
MSMRSQVPPPRLQVRYSQAIHDRECSTTYFAHGAVIRCRVQWASLLGMLAQMWFPGGSLHRPVVRLVF